MTLYFSDIVPVALSVYRLPLGLFTIVRLDIAIKHLLPAICVLRIPKRSAEERRKCLYSRTHTYSYAGGILAFLVP